MALEQGPQINLVAASGAAQLGHARELIDEYARGLGVDLCFQGLEAELAGLPGEYAEPAGALLLALVDGMPAGCVAMRPLPEVDHANACEMKRLYVRRAFRRFGLGRLLAQELMDLALRAGYSCMLLDTLDEMGSRARAVYVAGFRRDPAVLLQPHCRRALPEGGSANCGPALVASADGHPWPRWPRVSQSARGCGIIKAAARFSRALGDHHHFHP